MGRRKGKERKDKQLLIRVNTEEHSMAKRIAKERHLSMSELLRRLMKDKSKKVEKLNIHKIVIKKYEIILEKFRRLYSEYKKY